MNGIVKRDQADIVQMGDSGQINRLMEMALTNNADVGALERLMDLQERWEAKNAKTAFFKALAEFQSSVEPIYKKKQGHNTSYAPLPDIQVAIGSLLKKNELTYRFELQDRDSMIECSCVITHSLGHSERTTMSAPYDETGSKNKVQARGSTVTYLQRYTLVGALGLITADADMDGRTDQSAGYVSADQAIEIEDLIKEAKIDKQKFLDFFKADAVEHIISSKYERAVRTLRSKIK